MQPSKSDSDRNINRKVSKSQIDFPHIFQKNQVSYSVWEINKSLYAKNFRNSEIIENAMGIAGITNLNNDDYRKEDLINCNLFIEKGKDFQFNNIVISIFYLKDKKSDFKYQLGARDLIESMAYIGKVSLWR